MSTGSAAVANSFTVAAALGAVLSAHDNGARAAAEDALREMALVDAFGPILADLALGTAVPIHLRQSAAVSLKNYIEKHWSSREFHFIPPEPSLEAKQYIKTSVLAGLADAESRIRVLMAASATKIASFEDLETWPELFNSLMANLKSGLPDQIHGGLRVVSSFVDDISETQFAQIAPILLPQVYEIFMTEKLHPRVRSRAVSVFRKFLETLHNVQSSNPAVVEQFLTPQLPSWMQAFLSILERMDISSEQIVFKTEIIYSIEYLVTYFQKPMAEYFQSVLTLASRTAAALYPVYKATTIISNEGVDPIEEVNTDGDAMGLNCLLFNTFSIIGVAAETKAMDNFFGTDEVMISLVELGIRFSQISDGQMEAWQSDPSEYVQQEEETSPSFTMRYSITMLFDRLTTRHKRKFLTALYTNVMKLFDEVKSSRERGDSNWWRILESSLYCMCLQEEEIKKGDKGQFDFEGFFGHVVRECIMQNDRPLLKGRAIVFASVFCDFAQMEQNPYFIEAMVSALSSQQFPCRVSAVRAILKLLENSAMTAYLRNYVGTILEGMCNILPNANGDLLLLLLETLVPLVKVDEEQISKYEGGLIPLLLSVWSRDPEDSLVNVCVLNVFTTLSKSKYMFDALQSRLLAPLAQTISDENLLNNSSGVYANALMLLGVLIRGSSAPLPAVYMDRMFAPLIKAMKTTDGTKNGLGYTLDIVANLLSPTSDESSCLYIGNLITATIKKAQGAMIPILPDLLRAVMCRLATATYTQLIQTLILIFANLILEHGSAAVVGVLADMSVPSADGQQKNALELLLNMWGDYYEEVMGYYNMKLNAVALVTFITQSGSDERVLRVSVKGNPVPTEGIMTRSKARAAPDKFQTIPFTAKAFKLILKDYQQNRESALKGDSNGIVDEFSAETNDSEEDNSGEWEDEFTAGGNDDFDDVAEWENDKENDDTDPELINERVYNLSMSEFLSSFIKDCAQSNSLRFQELAQQALDDSERKILASIMSSR
ncbi:Importin 9 [Entophlyctis sp. JEL0112]|nr:Importin 9 [Entophlyctis sp. JEL0112]